MKRSELGREYDEDANTVEGDERAKTQIIQWLNSAIKRNIEFDGEVELQLFVVGIGSDRDPVFTTDWDSSERPDDAAEELREAAVEEAMNVGRPISKFKVSVAGNTRTGRCAFSLKVSIPEEFAEEMHDIDEDATPKGVLALFMRHQEKVMKVGLSGAGKSQEQLLRMLDLAHKQIAELMKRNAELENTHITTLKTYEELLSGKHARDLDFKRMEQDDKRKEEAFKMVMGVAPMLIQKFMAGKPAAASVMSPPQHSVIRMPQPEAPVAQEALKAAPGAPPPLGAAGGMTPLEMRLEQFLNSLTNEQLQKLLTSGILDGGQMTKLVEIAQVMQEMIAERDKGKGSVAPPAAAQGEGTASRPPQGNTIEAMFEEP